MRIFIIQHLNNKKQRQIPESEWINYSETESGRSWKVVKRINMEKMEEYNFVPPEISSQTKPNKANKRAIAEADKEAEK